jgi:hypothetical protein
MPEPGDNGKNCRPLSAFFPPAALRRRRQPNFRLSSDYSFRFEFPRIGDNLQRYISS